MRKIQVYLTICVLFVSCSDSTEFVGSPAKIVPKADKALTKLDQFIDSYLQSWAACDLEVVREAPDATVCQISVSVTSDLEGLTPNLSPSEVLEPWKVSNGVMFSRISCPASGVSVKSVFNQEIVESSESGASQRKRLVDVATCGAEVLPIDKPGCSLAASSNSIDLGTQVAVTLSLSDKATPVSAVTINGIAASPDKSVIFTPSVEGPFVVTGSVKNSAATETCSVTVTVNKPVIPPPVIPPSCALVATRESALATTCDVTLASTGGPIAGLPIASNGASLAAHGAGWKGKVACDAAGQNLAATVKNAQGTSAVCSAAVPAIEPTSCSVTAVRESAVSTRCQVTVTSNGGAVSETPKLEGFANLTQRATAWETVADCGVNEKIFKASVTNPRGLSTCESRVDPIKNPACAVSVDTSAIVLGQAVNATIKAVGDGVVVTSKINGAQVALDQPVRFSPAAAGDFLISGVVQNPASSEACSTTVKVSAPRTPPVIPPSCSIIASRGASNSQTKCNVIVSSTGGPISGVPVVSGLSLIQKNTSWEGVIDCNASAQTITASVTAPTGEKASCNAQVDSIPIWVQTNGGVCSTVCAGVKRVSARSPQYGNICVSGEVRGDAVGITYSHGTWGSGKEFHHSNSFGGKCYGRNSTKNQKQDNDKTDITVGCYCK